jgi:ABC-type glycerol-3-phosphate transport system substrate-binding protein
MNTQSQNKDAAWAFLKYIAVGEGAKEFANFAWTDVQPIIESQGLATDEFAGPIVADLPNVLPIPDQTTPSWAECGDKFFVQEINTVLEGDVSVKDAMDKAASEADACLAAKAAAAGAAAPAAEMTAEATASG